MTPSAASSTPANASGVRESSVRDRVQVGEVEHGPHPVEAGGEPEDVLGSAELADAAHDLDAEGDGAAFRLQALAEGGEVLGDGFERRLPLAPEQIARVDDEELGADGGRDPGRVVDHAERALALPLVGGQVAEDRGDRGMDGEGDLVLLRELAEARRPLPFGLHPEAALEVDLAGL